MNADYFMMEDCQATWQADARALALKEAEGAGYAPNDTSEKAQTFIAERTAFHHAKRERIAGENVR
jgi:hypothetical protein